MGDIPARAGDRDPGLPGRRYGIYGGSFDPVHRGHLVVADDVRVSFTLDRVVFVPANRSPFKPEAGASGSQRIEMVRLAIDGLPWAEVSSVEIDRPAPSYTIDTLRYFSACLPGTELFLIIGADALTEFAGWRDPEGILELATLIAVARPGSTLDVPASVIDLLGKRQHGIVLHQTASHDTSSRAVRARVRDRVPVSDHVPDAVARYIELSGIYGKS
ncbi:MAG: nicotinate (nicotinamide) nucleotide adenylyltransferase [Chloroflexi bacterium]|nr:nicotinate (nicotinamide) nucleotide adenylyltransferase [Chloroflexota bacterium]